MMVEIESRYLKTILEYAQDRAWDVFNEATKDRAFHARVIIEAQWALNDLHRNDLGRLRMDGMDGARPVLDNLLTE